MLQLNLSCLWQGVLLALALSSAVPAFGAPVITEFLAANSSGLADEDGDFSDWIEIHNPDSAPSRWRAIISRTAPANLRNGRSRR